MTAGITWANPSASTASIAGPSKPKQLAATITPPVKPNMVSSHIRFIPLKKNTKAAPAAVKSQVAVQAIKAASTGSIDLKNSTNSSMLVYSNNYVLCCLSTYRDFLFTSYQYYASVKIHLV